MRPFLTQVTLFLITSLIVAGCGGDDDPAGPGSGATISAVVNGAAWSAETPLSNAQHNVAGEILVMTGLNPSNYSMVINLAGSIQAGAFQLHNVFPLRFAVVTTNAGGSWSSTYAGGGGSVTITSLTESRVRGTFSFTAGAAPSSTVAGALTVTDGQFDLPLQRVSSGQ